TFATH
ncbi:Lipopolysaccharide export system protein LptC, partial [Haemophilus influenzae]